jgi:Phage protein (N4 Gp49/phage Sf6 gene 66) family
MNNRDGEAPVANEQVVENKIQELGLTAPRVTPDQIDAQIVAAYFFVAFDGVIGALAKQPEPLHDDERLLYITGLPVSLSLLTFCVLVLKNGFTVTGESACASPENFNEQLGRDIAYRNARDKIWSLEGYALRTKLAEQVQP